MNNSDIIFQNPDSIMPQIKEKFSDIFLISYSYSPRGFPSVIPKREMSLAYCIEPPHKVFEELYPDYVVTNYNGFDFFDKEKLKHGDKAYGLGIRRIDPVLAGGVRLEKVLNLEYLENLKRSSPKSKQEAQKIISKSNEYLMNLEGLHKQLLERGIKDFYENQKKGPSKKIEKRFDKS